MATADRDTGHPDIIITGCAVTLTCIGLILIFSTSSPLTFGSDTRDMALFFKKSLLFALVGAFAFWIASRIPTGWLKGLAYLGLVVSVVLLFLVWVPSFGVTVNGATRWIRLAGFQFQPSEPAKLALVIFLAYSLAKREERIGSLMYGYLPNILLPAIPILMVLVEPDFGTAALMGVLVATMCYCGGVKVRYLLSTGLLMLPAVYILLWHEPYRRARITAFLDPWKHRTDEGFQLVQSFLAFGNGGVWGVGLGGGKQKLFYLPEAHTDFILSIWAEETGLFGVICLLLIVVGLVSRGFWIAIKSEERFERLLATGLATWLGLQAGLNALVVTGGLPTKGLSFPFLSYGGTGLVTTLAGAGILAGLTRRRG